MIKFDNNARGLYEDGLRYIASDLVGIKKKDLIRKMNNFSDCDKFMDWVIKSAILRGKSRLVDEMVATLAYCYDFESAKRFYIPKSVRNSDVEDINVSADELFKDIDGAVYIETMAKDLKVILRCSKLDVPINLSSASYKYCINIFTYESDILNKTLVVYDTYKSIAKYAKFMSVLFTEDFEKFSVIVPKSNEFINKCCDVVPLTMISGEERAQVDVLVSLEYSSGKHKETASAIFSIAQIAQNCAKYVMYCYNNRYTLSRKNGKARRHYESNKVYTAKEDKSVDTLISLRTYVKEYESSTESVYKGGHHASPIEHDRCAYYRKSRGVGDYDLVNGEFVYVGSKKGSYSYVKPTHVNGKKKFIVYKV